MTSTLSSFLRLVLFPSILAIIFLLHLVPLPVQGTCTSVILCEEILINGNPSKKNCSTKITCENGTVRYIAGSGPGPLKTSNQTHFQNTTTKFQNISHPTPKPHPNPIIAPPQPNPELVKKLAESQAKIDALQSTLARMNASILSRIAGLEHNNAVSSNRVAAVEKTVTDFKATVQHQIADVGTATDAKVADLGSRLAGEMNALGTAVNGTRAQLRTLEAGKVQKLLNHNEVWKKNFKAINTTLNKLGRNVRVG